MQICILKVVDEPLSKRWLTGRSSGRLCFGWGLFIFEYGGIKQMKKSISCLLALAMLLGTLSACGGGQASSGSQQPASSSTGSSTSQPAGPAPGAPAAPAVDTVILKEADDKMINTYTLLAVNPDAPFVDADGKAVADVAVNTAGAEALIQWLLSDEED